ncbi:hypothetical protein GOP47_0020605 [Adiantum capillus-veneris]|uniref:Uncharacterized protein n=1 Tax=Adiantum capillus-veneris TaxID=13818 RepID=A0A9D4U9Q1_ADICA|nr:hypothetical protein GOP47_0020605 [Adiantum capillus-veneris]
MANGGLLRRVSAPLASAWRSLLHRFSRNSRGARSFAKLYHDVQTCAYEDVQVMWSIIHQQSFVGPMLPFEHPVCNMQCLPWAMKWLKGNTGS